MQLRAHLDVFDRVGRCLSDYVICSCLGGVTKVQLLEFLFQHSADGMRLRQYIRHRICTYMCHTKSYELVSWLETKL